MFDIRLINLSSPISRITKKASGAYHSSIPDTEDNMANYTFGSKHVIKDTTCDTFSRHLVPTPP